ncbi:MAG: PD-(D/E)XK nuclease family protein [Bacteroidota bacterium]
MILPFLESLAIHLARQSGPGLGDTRIILPNRRSGLFLQRHLSRHNEQVQWAPRIYAISDFINESSELSLSDPVELLFSLYDLYHETVQAPDPLDEFYFWGEIMLRDFDELDKYLVDAEMLFRNIQDLKMLEEPLAGLDEEQLKFIRQFWAGFHEGDLTGEKEKFLDIWKLLPLLYDRLKTNLTAGGEGYLGMQYREIAERIDRGEMDHEWKGRTLIVGFNALNSSEKKIFSWLHKHGAEFFWDYDHQYVDDAGSEAGRFMRENRENFQPKTKLEDFRGMDADKQIRIFELPTDVLQAKTVHRILEEEEAGEQRDCTDTALVLCDEELLMPVIMSLPESTGEINVTMGYPMKNTPVFSFIDSLLRLQKNVRKGSEGQVSFYHKDVSTLLLHPYMRNMEGDSGSGLMEEITGSNLFQVDSRLFTGEFEKKIFRNMDEAGDLLTYLRTIFTHILEQLAGEEADMHRSLDREFIFQLLMHLNKLETLLARRPSIPVSVLERLIRKQLTALRIPFEGEPLSGLQLMGILETRLLDFRHVILLSMNEEVMPASFSAQSYIPYALRLAFNMPAREDMDAIYAYYFKRLLQRAEKIDLLYNSGSEGIRTGEMSRYLYQLMYSKGIRVIRPGLEVMARETPALEVRHTPEIVDKLSRYSYDNEDGPYLSPSAINTYIDCSLKFYLRYLAGIGEADEVTEEIDAAGFGTVVHDSIRELYETISGRNGGSITREELQRLRSSGQAEEVLKRAFIKQHFRGRKRAGLEGKNILIFRVMLRYLEKIIETDMAIAPFQLVSAEQRYVRRMDISPDDRSLTLRMGGKIDRVDRVGDSLRVIDYKTGNARQGFQDMKSLFDRDLISRNGAAMQTLFYAWLVSEEHQGQSVLPGLYVMKALYGKKFDPALTMGSHSRKLRIHSFSELEEEYISGLKEVLSRMFDPDIPFTQRAYDVKCTYCDFAQICNRISIDS